MGWWIALAILAVIVLLFLLPVTVTLEARQPGNAWVKVGYLFFSFKFPKEEKEKKRPKHPKKSAPSQQEESQENALHKFFTERPLGETISMLKEILKQMGRAMRSMLRHVKVNHLCFDMAVAGEDAADTAIQYGKTCAAVYSAFAVACNAVRVTGIREFAVIPDFTEGSKTRFYLHARIRVELLVLLAIGAAFLLTLFRTMMKQKMTVASGQTTQEKAV